MDGTMRKTESEHVHCVLDPGCASRRLFEAVSGKWSPLIVMALKDGGKKRYGDSKGASRRLPKDAHPDPEAVGDERPRRREVHPVVPPKVEYSLTPLGRSLQPLLEAICQWSERRLPEVEEARLHAGADPFDCGT